MHNQQLAAVGAASCCKVLLHSLCPHSQRRAQTPKQASHTAAACHPLHMYSNTAGLPCRLCSLDTSSCCLYQPRLPRFIRNIVADPSTCRYRSCLRGAPVANHPTVKTDSAVSLPNPSSLRTRHLFRRALWPVPHHTFTTPLRAFASAKRFPIRWNDSSVL